ncbi:hypothetical protein [Photobacterium damselae]|uniref:hypothetical protein n=1 Tax=Photobacterium damselae TaxID=38293 RepID=UPI002543A33E
MNFTILQVHLIVDKFMPKVSSNSVLAMIDVLHHGHSILKAATNNGVTHQSLTKNINRFLELNNKSSRIFKQNLMTRIWHSKEVRSVYISAVNKVGFWEDFPDEGLEKLISMANKVGINDPDELMEFIVIQEPKMKGFLEKIYDEHSNKEQRNWRISFCFVVQLMLILGNIDKITVKDLNENGWEEEIASLVIKVASNLH